MQAFKEAAAGITKEYFQSEDASDAAASLKGLDDDEFHDLFVKQVGPCIIYNPDWQPCILTCQVHDVHQATNSIAVTALASYRCSSSGRG